MATINVLDSVGATVALEKPLAAGQAAMAASRPVVIASDQSTVPVSLASVPSHAVTNAGTFAVQATLAAGATTIAKAEDVASADADVGVPAMAIQKASPADTAGTDGDYAMLQMSAGRLWGSSQSYGEVAHDGADSGNPIKNGYKATTSLSGLTLVADADRTNGFAGIDGVQIVRPHCNLEDLTSGVAAITDGSSTSVIASQGGSVKTYVTTVIIANTSATAVTVDIRDGAAGTVKATLPVPANTSGVVCNLPVPLGFSAATAVCADPSAAASTITVTLIGFKSKV